MKKIQHMLLLDFVRPVEPSDHTRDGLLNGYHLLKGIPPDSEDLLLRRGETRHHSPAEADPDRTPGPRAANLAICDHTSSENNTPIIAPVASDNTTPPGSMSYTRGVITTSFSRLPPVFPSVIRHSVVDEHKLYPPVADRLFSLKPWTFSRYSPVRATGNRGTAKGICG